ncbi:MAG: hypothetical protein V3R98_13655 [Alphaproteobacteria bacterium]
MTVLQGVALFVVAYLLLLARSAWKQGEMRQYLRSLAIVAALAAAIAAIAAAYGRLGG